MKGEVSFIMATVFASVMLVGAKVRNASTNSDFTMAYFVIVALLKQ